MPIRANGGNPLYPESDRRHARENFRALAAGGLGSLARPDTPLQTPPPNEQAPDPSLPVRATPTSPPASDTEVQQIPNVVIPPLHTHTIPPVPTGLTATPSFKGLAVYWDVTIDDSIEGYELWASQTPFTPDSMGTLAYTGVASSYFFPANTGETWYFRVRAYNYFQEYSDWSSSTSATAQQIQTPDIAPLAITADKIAPGTITEAQMNWSTHLIW